MARIYKGLSADEVERSRAKWGTNELKREPSRGFFVRFFANLGDPIIRILLIALGLELLFTFGRCDLVELFGIVAAILIATLVSTLSECTSERAFLRLEALSGSSGVRVRRGGETVVIPPSEIVVGDIILIGAGERIEADGIMLEGEIEVDQSGLNGEGAEIRKCRGTDGEGWELSDKGRVYRGSVISSGEGVMRAERIGGETYYGEVARGVQAEARQSPLKLRLSNLAKAISRIGYVAALLVGITYLFRTLVVDNSFSSSLILAALKDTKYLFSTLIHTLTLMITVIVVAVPEGLPMMITVVLSANMKRMVKDNILVKKPVGIETAGSLNILFTDKTGTLTEGRLSVGAVITETRTYKSYASLASSGDLCRYLTLSATYNSSAELTEGGAVGGNATDRALADFFGRSGESLAVIERIPFSSERKYSEVTLEGGLTLVKGAPEIIIPRCGYAYREHSGAVVGDHKYLLKQYNEAVSRGERVIAVALGSRQDTSLTLLCLIVLKDRIRAGVREAVRDAMGAGIQIVMLTGDGIETASAIASDCGFFDPVQGHIAMTSDALAALSDTEVKELLPKLRIVARALPKDKTRLVRLAEEEELVVGMTGDGVNDAPSLKLADVGFAMGGGTDVAKAAGDVVILDNSFTSITKTVLYGRTIFKSIRKFITFQLIMNLAACGITLLGQLIGIENPITIIQMLWVNIIMDTLGGLAFSGEHPEPYYMLEPPKQRDEPILSASVLSHILPNGLFTLALLLLFLIHPYFAGRLGGALGVSHLTAFFALFIFAGIFNSFSARSERLYIFSGVTKNKPFLFIMALISFVQVLIVYFGGELFRSSPLSASDFMLVLLVASSVLAFDMLRRVVKKLS